MTTELITYLTDGSLSLHTDDRLMTYFTGLVWLSRLHTADHGMLLVTQLSVVGVH